MFIAVAVDAINAPMDYHFEPNYTMRVLKNPGYEFLFFHFVFIKWLETSPCHHFVSKRIAAISSENRMKLLRDNTKQRWSLNCISRIKVNKLWLIGSDLVGESKQTGNTQGDKRAWVNPRPPVSESI